MHRLERKEERLRYVHARNEIIRRKLIIVDVDVIVVVVIIVAVAVVVDIVSWTSENFFNLHKNDFLPLLAIRSRLKC